MDRWTYLLNEKKNSPDELLKKADQHFGLLVFDPEIAVEDEDGCFHPVMKLSESAIVKFC